MTTSKEFPIHGRVAPGFEAVRETFADNFHEDVEVGAAFAVHTTAGETLVDLWGGFTDPACTSPWIRLLRFRPAKRLTS